MSCKQCGSITWCNTPDGGARCEGCGKIYTWQQFKKLFRKSGGKT